MKTIYTLSLLLALLIGVVCGATIITKSKASAESVVATAAAEPVQASPFPDIPIPGVPSTGNCCLTQLEKRVQGTRKVDFTGNPYACPTGATQRGVMRVDMQLVSAGNVCDPLLALIPNNSKLVATGNVIRRRDGFAHFIADFAILNPAGTALFKGTMETIDRIGTHHLFFNCEQCNTPSHFEGWIVGRGTAAVTSNFTIRAMIVSRGTVPSPAQVTTPMTGSLNGTLIRCP
ncbi:MAG: hypothetical protein M3R52_08030 [Acidobacteriota bacterium]|nr:hypothetical protein [Acidobacteriota bacterium]